RFSVPLSKLMCCQCLLKQTRIYTFQLSNGSHVCCKRIHPKSSLVTWLITLGLIICPSSYKARPDNLIGLSISSQIFVRRSFLPNGATPDRTSRPKNVWAWLSSSGIQASSNTHQTVIFMLSSPVVISFHVLQMASKTGRTWLDCKKPSLADEFLSLAVKVRGIESWSAFT